MGIIVGNDGKPVGVSRALGPEFSARVEGVGLHADPDEAGEAHACGGLLCLIGLAGNYASDGNEEGGLGDGGCVSGSQESFKAEGGVDGYNAEPDMQAGLNCGSCSRAFLSRWASVRQRSLAAVVE